MIFKQKLSGKTRERPEPVKMIGQLKQGDVVVVWKLDHLGRSLKDLIELVFSFREKRIEFVSLKESIDTPAALPLIFSLPWQNLKEKSSGSVSWLACRLLRRRQKSEKEPGLKRNFLSKPVC